MANPNNDFNSIDISAKNASINNTNDLNFGTTSITENLTATTNGNITQSGVITVTGTTSFSTNGNNVILSENNDFNLIDLLAKNATINDSNALSFSATSITENLTVTTNGDITQLGVITVNGTTSLSTNGNDVILSENNDFSLIDLLAKNATINDSNALSFGTTSITENLTVTTNGNITQSGTITVNGTTSLSTNGYDVILSGNNDFNSTDLSAKNSTINDTNALSFGTTSITENLTVNTIDNLTTGDITLNGKITFTSTNGTITTGNLTTLGGKVTIDAKNSTTTGNIITKGGDVLLDPIGDIVTGFINTANTSGSGGNVTIITTGGNVRLLNTASAFGGCAGGFSICSIGTLGNGKISINHGGLNDFRVGDSSINGSAGTILSGSGNLRLNTLILNLPSTFILGGISITPGGVLVPPDTDVQELEPLNVENELCLGTLEKIEENTWEWQVKCNLTPVPVKN